MKKSRTKIIIILSFLLSFITIVHAEKLSLDWPKMIDSSLGKITAYQPQALSFENGILRLNMAIALKPTGKTVDTFGSIKAQCQFTIDPQTKEGQCKDFTISSIDVPSMVIMTNQLQNAMLKYMHKNPLRLSQEMLDINLEITSIQQSKSTSSFNVKPPKIYYSDVPTILVSIDGQPQLRKVKDSDLMRVINTAFIILNDPQTGQYYLRAGNRWMMASGIFADWFVVTDVPNKIKKIQTSVTSKPKSDSDFIEKAILTTEPAALLQSDGKPEFTPIKGTDLLYVENTDDNIFMHIKTQQYYALLSGRWYRSNNLNKKSIWTSVEPHALPKTFANIPDDSAKANVLASVVNSKKAKEAVIQNSVPTTAIVDRKKATLKVDYDGEPQFKPIKGTKIKYAANTKKAVLRVGNRYYANTNAVWFVAGNPIGPWTVAVSVPRLIYTIPVASPYYYLTFNYIYGYDPFSVYSAYFPGYFGSYIYNGALIYGTGFYNRGWIGNAYYGYPFTYGLGFNYNPYLGWYPASYYLNPFWFGAGLSLGLPPNFFWYNSWLGPLGYPLFAGFPFAYLNFYNSWGWNVIQGRTFFYLPNLLARSNLFRNQLQQQVLKSDQRRQKRAEIKSAKNKARVDKRKKARAERDRKRRVEKDRKRKAERDRKRKVARDRKRKKPQRVQRRKKPRTVHRKPPRRVHRRPPVVVLPPRRVHPPRRVYPPRHRHPEPGYHGPRVVIPRRRIYTPRRRIYTPRRRAPVYRGHHQEGNRGTVITPKRRVIIRQKGGHHRSIRRGRHR